MRVVERDAELERNELGDLVDVAVTHAEHAAHVAHHRLRRHGAVGDDLRDALASVLLRDVFDDAVAPVHAEVDVEVGHRHALGVQESLEQQVVFQRVDVGDAEAVGHQRSGARAAARPHGHAVGARPANEVRDDQEVAREPHLADDAELALQAVAVFSDTRELRLVENFLAFRESALRLGANMRLDGRAFGQWIVREPRFAELERQRTAPRDLHGIRQRFRNVGKELGHLRRCSQVLRRGVFARAVGVGEQRAFGNADARLVRFEIAGREEAYVVGGDDRDAGLLAQGNGLGDQRFIVRAPQALQFEVVAVNRTRPASRAPG